MRLAGSARGCGLAALDLPEAVRVRGHDCPLFARPKRDARRILAPANVEADPLAGPAAISYPPRVEGGAPSHRRDAARSRRARGALDLPGRLGLVVEGQLVAIVLESVIVLFGVGGAAAERGGEGHGQRDQGEARPAERAV